jgi:hypothetical protein
LGTRGSDGGEENPTRYIFHWRARTTAKTLCYGGHSGSCAEVIGFCFCRKAIGSEALSRLLDRDLAQHRSTIDAAWWERRKKLL